MSSEMIGVGILAFWAGMIAEFGRNKLYQRYFGESQ